MNSFVIYKVVTLAIAGLLLLGGLPYAAVAMLAATLLGDVLVDLHYP